MKVALSVKIHPQGATTAMKAIIPEALESMGWDCTEVMQGALEVAILVVLLQFQAVLGVSEAINRLIRWQTVTCRWNHVMMSMNHQTQGPIVDEMK